MTDFVFDEATGLLKRIADNTETVASAIKNATSNQYNKEVSYIKSIDNSITKIVNNKSIKTTNLLDTKREVDNKKVVRKNDIEESRKTSQDNLKSSFEKQEELQKEIIKNQKTFSDTNNRLRDKNGRFVKQQGTQTAKEKVEQQKSYNNDDDKEKIDININPSDLEPMAEAVGDVYYKSFLELKDMFVSGFEAIKTTFSLVGSIKSFFGGSKETKGETAGNERDKKKELELEEEENEILKNLQGGNKGIISKLIKWGGLLLGGLALFGKKLLVPLTGIKTILGGGFDYLKKNLAKVLSKFNPFSPKPKVKPEVKPKVKPKTATKTATKTAKTAKTAAKTATKTAAKTATKTAAKTTAKTVGKSGLKSLLKKFPVLGLIIGGYFALDRLKDGDTKGAYLEALSGALSTVPFIGTGGSLAIDGYLLKRDLSGETEAEIEKNRVKEKIQPKRENILNKKQQEKQVKKTYDTKKENFIKYVEPRPQQQKQTSQKVVLDTKDITKELQKQTEILKSISDTTQSKTIAYTPQKEAIRGGE